MSYEPMNESNNLTPEELASMTADEIFDHFGPDYLSMAQAAKIVFNASPEFTIDEFCEMIKQNGTKLQAHYATTMENLIAWPETVEQAYSAYAEAIGVTVVELEDKQKKQALLNHILEKGERAMERELYIEGKKIPRWLQSRTKTIYFRLWYLWACRKFYSKDRLYHYAWINCEGNVDSSYMDHG